MASLEKAIEQLGIDCVYMLLHYGWRNEPRGNRWHFATRWARHKPVVMVCPETDWLLGRRKPEPRIENCRVLEVLPNTGPIWAQAPRIQISQILADMRRQNFKRPLLWLYNAGFAEAFATLPAAARVLHVTENYFDFDWLPDLYLDRLKFIAEIADLNVAVSDGCAAPLRDFVSQDRLMIATNGCDFSAYGQPGPADEKVTSMREPFRRLAVYGGNINKRIDFSLVRRAAEACPDTLLLFVGANSLDADTNADFDKILAQPNVRNFGPVSADHLPAIYRAADFGFIPFVSNKFISENGFPLKTLEMAATGLPVVSTLMKPLLPHAPPLFVAGNDDEFIEAFRQATRKPDLSVSLKRLAAANDYDGRFTAIVSTLADVARAEGARLDDLARRFPQETANAVQDTLLRDGRSLRRTFGLIVGRIRAETRPPDIGQMSRNLREKAVTIILAGLDLLPKSLRSAIRSAKRVIFDGHRKTE